MIHPLVFDVFLLIYIHYTYAHTDGHGQTNTGKNNNDAARRVSIKTFGIFVTFVRVGRQLAELSNRALSGLASLHISSNACADPSFSFFGS